MRLMKRILSAAAVLALSASLLVGCSSGTASSVPVSASSAAAEVGLYEQISRLNNHRPFRLPPMRATTLNFFGTLSVRYELLAPM